MKVLCLMIIFLISPFNFIKSGLADLPLKDKKDDLETKIPKEKFLAITTHKRMVVFNKDILIFEVPHYKGSLVSPESSHLLCEYLGADGELETYTIGHLTFLEKRVSSVVKFQTDSQKKLTAKKIKSHEYVAQIACRSHHPLVGLYLQRRNFKSALKGNQFIYASNIKYPHQNLKGTRHFFSPQSDLKAICQLFGMDAPRVADSSEKRSISLTTDEAGSTHHKHLSINFIDKEHAQGWQWKIVEDKNYIESIICQKGPSI